jgi:hypothetical protein
LSIETTPAVDDADEIVGGNIAHGVMAAFWLVLLALYLSHSIVLSSDSINNHVHVWYVADNLWHDGSVPFRMPVLAHGDAYAYPYGFVNWTTAALAWPLFGNWVVTLWTALGAVGCLVATFLAFPELRRGWWAAAVLANPAIIEALLFGQQSFAWAAMLLLFGIAAWRRGHRAWAAILIGIGQATHAAIVLPIGVVLFLLYLPFTRDRWAAIRWYALSCLITLPAVWLVLASPVNADTSAAERQLNFWITLGPRVLIVVLPLFYAVLHYARRPILAPLALVASIGFSIGFHAPLNVQQQVSALFRWDADTGSLDAYLESPQFVEGATYRVLRGGDGKLGLYHVLQAGGRLDAELFPEGMAMHDFDDTAEYQRLLCDRGVDQVLHIDEYDEARHTNERSLLDALTTDASASVHVTVLAQGSDWRAYGIDRRDCAAVPDSD